MPAYIISRVFISDRDAMTGYMAEAPHTVHAYGGEYLARTGNITILEGQASCDRVVVLKFPDKKSALAWYNSPEYRPLRGIRWKNARAEIICLPDET